MNIFEVLKKHFSIALKYKKYYLPAVFLMVIGTIASRSIPIGYGWIIDNIEQNNYTLVIQIVIGIIAIKMIGDIIKAIGDQFNDIALLHYIRYARIKFITAIQSMDYGFHAEKSSGRLISIAKRGENSIYTMMVDVNIYLLEMIVEFVLAFIVVSTIDPRLGGILLIVILSSIILGVITIKHNIKLRRKANKQDDNISALTIDNLLGFETVKIFAKEKEEQERFHKAYIPWYKTYVDFSTSFRWLEGSQAIVGTFGFVLSIIFGIIFIQDGAISIGEFVTAMTFVFGIISKSRDIVYKLRQVVKVYIDLGQYFENMDLEPDIEDTDNPEKLNLVEGDIKYENVSFSYSNDELVIEDFSLHIKSKETVALVGYSGSGKTTLTKLLMRFYEPDKGEILLDGLNLKNILKRDLRKQIGLVPQDPILFNDSIGFNISYSDNDADQEKIVDAAKKANLYDFIMTLPNKFETIVGERGIKLSGGQKQRLAIARTILENPPIIIFDEATSQLDSKNEKTIHEAFENLTENKTTIIIAHRLSTVRNADKIVVMNDGKIDAIGTHKDLLENNRTYSELWEMQTNNIL